MKASEAIEILIGIRCVSGYSKSREEALDMAIAALEKQEGEGGLTMAEYIEREAAIKIVNTPNYNKHDMLFALKTIPAASAADVVEVVRCHECVHHVDCGYYFCNMWCANCPDDGDFFCAYGERDGGVNDAVD